MLANLAAAVKGPRGPWAADISVKPVVQKQSNQPSDVSAQVRGPARPHCSHGRHHPGPACDHRRCAMSSQGSSCCGCDPHLGLLRRFRLRRRHRRQCRRRDFLSSVLGWVLGLVFALIFAVLAYLYYYVAIVIAMEQQASRSAPGSSSPWESGTGGCPGGPRSRPRARPRLGARERADHRAVIVGSMAGAVGVTGGLMLLVGSLNTADFSRGDFADTVSKSLAGPCSCRARRRRHRHPGRVGRSCARHPRGLDVESTDSTRTAH